MYRVQVKVWSKGVCPAMKGRRTGMVVEEEVEDESLKVCADVKKRQSHIKEKELDYPHIRIEKYLFSVKV